MPCKRRRHRGKENGHDADQVQTESQRLFREAVRQQVLEEAEKAAAKDEPLPKVSDPSATYERMRTQFQKEYFTLFFLRI